jgi:hypothetical protein
MRSSCSDLQASRDHQSLNSPRPTSATIARSATGTAPASSTGASTVPNPCRIRSPQSTTSDESSQGRQTDVLHSGSLDSGEQDGARQR